MSRLPRLKEMSLFYQACDEMGMLLFQDMPALRPLQDKTYPNCTSVTILPDAAQQAEFQRQLEVLVKQHRNYPSIITWTPVNESWAYTSLKDNVEQRNHLRALYYMTK